MTELIRQDEITAIYQVTCAAHEIAAQAKQIALEQTVEVPESLVSDPAIREHVVGRVVDIAPVEATASDDMATYHVHITYNAALANGQLPQLLNLIYGNISIKHNIRLVDVQLPQATLAHFDGPATGVAGVRELLGVYDRPLLSTAIKPRGSSVDIFADIARQFALGGGDIVKDDHNLVDDAFDAFTHRIAACHQSVEQANMKTGRRCLYFPNVCARFNEIEKHVDAAVKLGIRGILISPLLVGPETVRYLAATYPLIIMTHPTFAGTFFHDPMHGIEPGVLLGTMFRLAGADISVFPNYGGRFGFSRAQCMDIAARMTQPLGTLKAGLPAPAGGMQFANVPQMARAYGKDAVLLVGGALLSHCDNIADGTRAFHDAMCEHFTQRLVEPQREMVSACEVPLHAGHDDVVIEHLPFADYQWQGREGGAYKPADAADELPFDGVSRCELLGRFGEPMAFNLRYFEIQPGGFSSREKHQHVHAIIGIRGKGELQLPHRNVTIKPMDIAYVPPMRVHQLRNAPDSKEPFGFFCIVDNDRDRPRKP